MRLIDADVLIDEMKKGKADALSNAVTVSLDKPGEGLLCGVNMAEAIYSSAMLAVYSAPTIDQVKRGEWIPCCERLPEEKKAVYWACNDSGEQFECRWTNASPFSGREIDWDWHWNIFDVPQYTKVVAWMPLPEPYKEQEDEEDRPTQISAEFAKLMTEGEIKVSNIDVSEFGRKRSLVIITAERNEE